MSAEWEHQTIPQKYAEIFGRIFADPRYEAGLKYGVPRPQHPEGTVGKHLVDLQCNLMKMRVGGIVDIATDEYWRQEAIEFRRKMNEKRND